MIRVVQVLEATTGGTRKHLREIVMALPPDEFQVLVVCSTRRDKAFHDDISLFRSLGCEVETLDMVRQPHPYRDTVACVKLRRLLRSWAGDILHLHSAKAGWIGRIAARGLQYRVAYSPHAFPFLQKKSRPYQKLLELAENWAARWTDLLVAVTAEERNIAITKEFLRPEQVVVLPNSVSIETLDREAASHPVPEEIRARVFGFIGELRAQKGPFVFLEAVRIVADKIADTRFVLPAWGSDLPKVRRSIRRLGLEGQVSIIPPNGSLMPIYLRADVSVLSSFWEGLPYALLESMAVRRPVIASDIPPMREILAPLGEEHLFEPGNARHLAERLTRWATAPASELLDAGERSRALVEREFRLDSWRQQVRSIYCALHRL